MIDLEICGDSFESALLAADYKFKRIELCANLTEGGTTPSFGMIQKCASLKTIEVHVMIRPRPGSFVCSQTDLDIMARDMVAAAIAGAKGVVFGCLTKENELDLQATLYLAEVALKQKLEFTFHRAIDSTPNSLKTLEHLHKLGFSRILTSGSKTSVTEGLNQLKEMVSFSQKNPIQIMAGGGVNATNAKQLAEIGIHALHFTARKKISNNLPAGMGEDFENDEEKIKQILNTLS
jgi:copper homeostasis protein